MNQQQQQHTARNRALWNSQNQEELEMLEQIHLHALQSNKNIRDALKTKELQDLIRNIDKSKCRLEALAAAQHNIPQFREFCQLLLSSIYGAEDSKTRY
jgi:hypothetical protein